MVGPAVLTFAKELGEFYGTGARPQLFGFIDSLEAVDIASPGLEFLDGSHFWKPIRATSRPMRRRRKWPIARRWVSMTTAPPPRPADVATYSHMFSVWETLSVIKAGMEAAGYTGPADRQKLVEAIEAMTEFAEGEDHPQGHKVFNGKTHQRSASSISRRSRGAG